MTFDFDSLFQTYITDCLTGGPRDHRTGFDTVDMFHQRLDSYREDTLTGDCPLDGTWGLSHEQVLFCLDYLERD